MTIYHTHITRELDRWDTLAWQYYGDASRFEAIIRANPHLAIHPVLPAGQKVLIPAAEAQSIPAGPLPPWKKTK